MAAKKSAKINYWLMKSEPDVYSIDHLSQQKRQIDHWDGIRNYQARNFIRDDMKVGDQAFFYHSSCPEPGVAGVMEIAKAAYPDHTAFDPESEYFDAKSNPDNPRWFMVDVRFVRKFPRVITLNELRGEATLAKMRLLQRGNRLSIMPVARTEWNRIVKMSNT